MGLGANDIRKNIKTDMTHLNFIEQIYSYSWSI